MGRLVGVSGLCAAAALVWAGLAQACSCGVPADTDGERDALAAGGKAFIGRVVAKRPAGRRPGGPRVFTYRVRVGHSFNVRLGRSLRLTSSADYASCGFEWRVGELVAGYLGGRAGRWSTGSCLLTAPHELLRDSQPYPAPPAGGHAAALAYGPYSGARAIALDRRGRIVGYGFGGGHGVSVCPGFGTVVEIGVDRKGRARIYTRRISDLRVLTARRVPPGTEQARCLDPSGSTVAVLVLPDGTGDESTTPFRLMRMEGRASRVLRRGVTSHAALSRRFAFTLEGRSGARLQATDLGNGRSRPLARIARAGPLALNQDGTRVALLSEGLIDPPRRRTRLAVVDLNGPIPSVRLRSLPSPSAGGELVWQDAGHLLRLPYGERVRPALRYDSELRPLGRFGSFASSLGVAGDARLLAVDGDRFRSVDRAGGGDLIARGLPTTATVGVLPLAREPWVATDRRRPVPRRPVVRRACSIPPGA